MRPVDLAEQALAGALLLDPSCAHDLTAWLRPDDFADAGCAAVYHVASDSAARGEPVDARVLRRDLDALPGLHPYHRSPARLHEFMQSCPLHPQPVLYGRIVLEAAIRRQVQLLGLRVEASTLVEAPTGPAAVLRAVAETLAHLRSLDMRWCAAHVAREGHPRHAEQQKCLLRVTEAAAERYLARTPGPDQATVVRAERAVLQEILSQPALLTPLSARLRPEDFLDSTCAATYAVMLSLHEDSGSSGVDAVSLSWEQQRRNVPGLSAAELRRLANTIGIGVDSDVDLVLRAALHRFARQVRASVQHAAGDPTRDPADLLDTAARSYESVHATLIRTTGAIRHGQEPGGRAPPRWPPALRWRARRSSTLDEQRPSTRLPPAS